MNKQQRQRISAWILTIVIAGTGLARAQPPAQAPAQAPPTAPYKPNFPGDPARSEPEAQALAYMRTMLRAQREYKKRHNHYAESLLALAGTGSFTKRLAQSTERGDYTVGFRSQKDGFQLAMTPKQLDAEHRSFYAGRMASSMATIRNRPTPTRRRSSEKEHCRSQKSKVKLKK